jgi:TolA-binding protein
MSMRQFFSGQLAAVASMLLMAASPLRAQDDNPAPPPRDRPVMPGTPVGPPPANEPPVARAVPFDTPVPVAKAAPAATPVPASAPTAPSGDDSDDIRIAPQAPGAATVAPDVVQFNLANDFYVRKDFTQAAAEYERYLGQFSDGAQRQAALWWLGECYRNLNRPQAARSSYQNLVISFQDGEFVGPACFRLATLDFNEKDYRTALPLYARSADLAKADDVRLSSLYFQALCMEQLNRREETRPIYERILTLPNNALYRDEARLALARIALADKRTADAFTLYDGLSRDAQKTALQAEAALRAALLARELNQNDAAAALLTRAISLPAASAAVHADALIAQLHLYYDTNKYRQLTDAYQEELPALPEALQAEAMLLAGNAQRQLGQHAKAQNTYDELLTQFPRSPEAPEARYQRIISLYASNDANFVHQADEFLDAGPDPVKGDQVRLMKADALFKQGNYFEAADSYSLLDSSPNLSAKYKAEAAYRLGYCYAQGRDATKTIAAFTRFLRLYPDHPFVTKALVQRAVAYQQLKDYANALHDFNEIIDNHKDAKEREIALEQKALVLGQQGNDKEMTETLHTLLADYPKTDAAGMANFYIGRSAFAAADYPGALEAFQAARKASPEEYGAKAGLLIILCEYQLKDQSKLSAEIDTYQSAKSQPPVPAEILRWLGEQEFDSKQYAQAESHFASATGSPGNQQPDTWLLLARARNHLLRWDAALEACHHYIDAAPAEPAARAQGLLVQGEAQIGLRHFDDAQKSADDALQLQPEGTLNAKARLLGGKIALERGDYTAAAKSFMSVSVLYDDPDITPRALALAAQAYAKAGQTEDATRATDDLKKRFPAYSDDASRD